MFRLSLLNKPVMLSPYLSIFPISGTTVQAKTQRSLDRLSKVKKNHLIQKKLLFFICLIAVFSPPLLCCWQQNSLKKKSLPPLKFLEGEVIWAKFNRRPWWPCEVFVDPAQGIYHRVKGGCGTLLTCWLYGLMHCIWVVFNSVTCATHYFGLLLIVS